METFIAVTFPDRRRAAQALSLLWRSNDKLDIELDDAVIVHCDHEGNLEYDQDSPSMLERGLVWAGLWGSLIGALAAVAFAVVTNEVLNIIALGACALAAGLIVTMVELSRAGDCAARRDFFGVPKGFVQEVVDGISPGDSAVVAWLDSDGLETAAPTFRGFGGKLLRTTLPPEEVVKLESVLHGDALSATDPVLKSAQPA